jgi:hypothetical protein
MDTNTFFNAGEGDEGVGDTEFKVSGFMGLPAKIPEYLVCDRAPPSPDATGFILAVWPLGDVVSEPADAPADP